MKITPNAVRSLQSLFNEAWGRVSSGNRPVCVSCSPDSHPDDDEFWTLYMNSLDCLMIDQDDLMESFPDMVNFGASVKNTVCLSDPCNEGDFILVELEYAEKAIVLGSLA
jgi:hypothetical protein